MIRCNTLASLMTDVPWQLEHPFYSVPTLFLNFHFWPKQSCILVHLRAHVQCTANMLKFTSMTSPLMVLCEVSHGVHTLAQKLFRRNIFAGENVLHIWRFLMWRMFTYENIFSNCQLSLKSPLNTETFSLKICFLRVSSVSCSTVANWTKNSTQMCVFVCLSVHSSVCTLSIFWLSNSLSVFLLLTVLFIPSSALAHASVPVQISLSATTATKTRALTQTYLIRTAAQSRAGSQLAVLRQRSISLYKNWKCSCPLKGLSATCEPCAVATGKKWSCTKLLLCSSHGLHKHLVL